VRDAPPRREAKGNVDMSRPITLEEVVTYADALIKQYIEKKRVSKLPQQLASSPISIIRSDETTGQLLPTLLGKEHKFDTVLESVIYQHSTRAFNRDVDVSSPTITIERGVSIPMRSTLSHIPSLPDIAVAKDTPPRRSTVKRPTTATNDGFKTPTKTKDDVSLDRRKSFNKTSPFVRKKRSSHFERPQSAPAGVFTITSSHSTSRSGKARSKENWIPDHIREKM
jgi:hypothetical protein